MIVVNAIVRTTPEQITALQDAVRTIEIASRAEPGCEDYTFSVELNDPNTLRITEKWRTLEDLQAHFETPHVVEFQAIMGEQPPASMEAMFYEVTEIQPFE